MNSPELENQQIQNHRRFDSRAEQCFITSVITVLEDILRQNGYGIIVRQPNRRWQAEDAIEFFLGKMVDGIVMMPVGSDRECLKPVLDKKASGGLSRPDHPGLENQVGGS